MRLPQKLKNTKERKPCRLAGIGRERKGDEGRKGDRHRNRERYKKEKSM